MFSSPTLALLSLLLALPVLSNPVLISSSPVTLPFIKNLKLSGSDTLLKSDRARAQAFAARANSISKSKLDGRAVISDPVSNQGQSSPHVTSHVASVGIGSPPTQYNLLVDIATSNTWIGASGGAPYVKTKTSTPTDNIMMVSFNGGSFSGPTYIDQVTIAPGLVISKQSIGVANDTNDSRGYDGFLGLGPVGLTTGTLVPARTQRVPTVTDNLFSQGTISANEFSIYFDPKASTGEVTFGGTDSSKFTGKITYAPITRTSPASQSWGLDQTVKYGTTHLLTSAGVLDIGSNLILLASDSFATYKSLTGGVMDQHTALLSITAGQYAKLKSLFFTIGDTTFELTPNAQIWPRALNKNIGGLADSIYLIVNDLGPADQGFGFVNGNAFLERFYSVYDTANHRVGLATTSFTKATLN